MSHVQSAQSGLQTRECHTSTRSRGWLHLCGFCIMNHFDVLVLHAYSVHLILGTNVVFFPHRTFLFYHSILTSRTFPGQQQHQHSISVFQSTVAMHSVPCCSLILLPSTTELLVRKWQEGQSAISVVLAIAQEHSARMSRSSLEVCLLSCSGKGRLSKESEILSRYRKPYARRWEDLR